MEAGRLLGPSQGQQSGVESLLNRVTAFRQAPSASPSPEAARFWAVSHFAYFHIPMITASAFCILHMETDDEGWKPVVSPCFEIPDS